MADERLSRWLLGRDRSARDGAMRGLLSALWSFLQHPAATFEDHLTALEGRLRVLEARLVGNLETEVDTGVVAVEETVAARSIGSRTISSVRFVAGSRRFKRG
jgi:hypothetical protein